MLERFNCFMVTAILNQIGFVLEDADNVEIWHNPKTGKRYIIEISSAFLTKQAVLNILKQAGVTLEEFKKLI